MHIKKKLKTIILQKIIFFLVTRKNNGFKVNGVIMKIKSIVSNYLK